MNEQTRASTQADTSSSSDSWYAIKDIIAERRRKGGIQYLVAWEPDSETGREYRPTWEPLKNVTQVAIDAWEAEDEDHDDEDERAQASQAEPALSGQPSTEESDPVRIPNWRRRKRPERESPGSLWQAADSTPSAVQKKRRTYEAVDNLRDQDLATTEEDHSYHSPLSSVSDTGSVEHVATHAVSNLVIELPQVSSADRSEYLVIPSSQQSNSSSQAYFHPEEEHLVGGDFIERYPGSERRALDSQRIIPDSEAASGDSISTATNSGSQVDQLFATYQDHFDPIQESEDVTSTQGTQTLVQLTEDIPSHQLDVSSGPERWPHTVLSTGESSSSSRRVVQAREVETAPHQLTQEDEPQTSESQQNPVFLTQIPFDFGNISSTSEPEASSRRNERVLIQNSGILSASSGTNHSNSRIVSTSQNSSSQAAQRVQHLSADPNTFQTQVSGDFEVFDDEDQVVPETVTRYTQQRPTAIEPQFSQSSSQVLSELDGNTGVSTSSSARARSLQQGEAHVELETEVSLQKKTSVVADFTIVSQQQSEAPPRALDQVERHSIRLEPAGIPGSAPATMESTSATTPTLSARDRLRLISTRAFSQDETSTPTGSSAAPSEPPEVTANGAAQQAAVASQAEPVEHTETQFETAIVEPGLSVPLPSMTLAPELQPTDITLAGPGSTAPEQSALQAAAELLLDEVPPVGYDTTHEVPPATLNPSNLTLSIEGPDVISPSLPTDDVLATGLGIAEVTAAGETSPALLDETESQPYPRTLRPYIVTDANEYLVTLPLVNHARPQYNDIIREYAAEITEYNSAFFNVPHQTPDPAITEKIDDMFSRLFDLCDTPLPLEDIWTNPPIHITKHAVGTNGKFAFVYELLSNLRDLGSTKKILILARPGPILDFLVNMMKTEEYHYSRLGEESKDQPDDSSPASVMIHSTAEETSSLPQDYDVVIAFDHTFKAERLPAHDREIPPPVLLLALTNSLQHINMRISAGLEALERKNALLLSICQAMERVEDPEGHIKHPQEIADLFAGHIEAPEDEGFFWSPEEIPEDIFQELYLSSQVEMSQSQMNQAQAAPSSPVVNELIPPAPSRKRSFDDLEDMSSKRQKLSQPPAITTVAHISDSLKELIGGEPAKPAGSVVAVSVERLEAISTEIAKLKEELEESRQRAGEFRALADRTKKEVDGLNRSIRDMQPKFMEALKDRGTFAAESNTAKQEAKTLASRLEASAKDITELKGKNTELQTKLSEATEALLNSSSPDLVKLARLEKELDEAKAEVVRLEKKNTATQNDLEYTKDAYQQASHRASELGTENRQLEARITDLSRRADDNIVQVNQIQSRAEIRELNRMLNEQKAIVRDREAELNRIRDELRNNKNGRRETRQTSVPRSPRLGSLGVMSPRAATRPSVAMAAATSGAPSRGTSPAPIGIFDNSGAGGGPGGAGAAGGLLPGMQIYGSQPGNGRWTHLRD